jgi:tryptophan synthase alpha chain
MLANRIDQKFSELSAAGKKGLFPFLVAGQPDMETTKQLILHLAKLGVAGIELGFPFTDPVADGPVIQSAFTSALENGSTVAKIMKAIGEIRDQVDIPILAMVTASIVYRIGVEEFIEQANAAGFDGFIIPDLSLEEAPVIAEKIKTYNLRLAMLVSPASTLERQEKIVAVAEGFIYYMSIAGVTGERDKLPADMPANVANLKELSGIPVVVGFGIQTPQQVREVCAVADGAIVGSAFIRRIDEAVQENSEMENIISSVEEYAKELLTGLE